MRDQDNMRLKGQLKLYMRWPLIMSVLLIGMNIWVYMVDKKAGVVMSAGVILYIVVVGVLYIYNRSALFADLVQFADQYSDVQNTLLKELSIPYALLLESGKIIWWNNCFEQTILGEQQEKYLYRLIPQLNQGVYPKREEDLVKMDVVFN